MAREKKEKAAPPQIGGNIKGLHDKIAAGRDKVIELKAKRADINAKIGEVRASMEAMGVPKAAFDASLKYFEQDPDKRAGYDNGYIIAREAMGLPVKGAQLDLLGDDAENDQEGDDANEENNTEH